MKSKILILLILIAGNLTAQDLPVNPITGLVSIKDSVLLNGTSVKEFKSMLSKWRNYLAQKANVEKIYDLDSKNENISLSVGVAFFNSSSETQRDVFTNSGFIGYLGKKRDPVFKEVTSTDWTNGKITFNIIYSITSTEFIYEITNVEFSGGGSSGRFEDEKPVKPFSIGVLAQNKKRWKAIKTEYFERLKILSTNLKDYVKDYTAPGKITTEDSPNASSINYESYQKIKTGMKYNEVKEILRSEGKELRNSSSKVDGKNVTQQTIIWYESEINKSKYILLTFIDERVASKSQTDL